MSDAYFEKDPQAVKDYRFDWSRRLAAGDVITDAAVLVSPDGLVVEDEPAVAHDADSVTAWLSGGEPDTTYEVTCRITTSQGRTDDDRARVRVTD